MNFSPRIILYIALIGFLPFENYLFAQKRNITKDELPKNYIIKNYGKEDPSLKLAIEALIRSQLLKIDSGPIKVWKDIPSLNNSSFYIYSSPHLEDKIIVKKPFLDGNPTILMAVWDNLMMALPKFENQEHFKKLISRIELNILFYRGEDLYRKCHHSVQEKEKRSFERYRMAFFEILNIIENATKLNLELNNNQENKPNLSPYFIEKIAKPRWTEYTEFIQNSLDQRKKIDTLSLDLIREKWEKKIVLSSVLKNIHSEEWAKQMSLDYTKFKELDFNFDY